MSDFIKQALALPQSLRYQLAMLLLQSLGPDLIQEESLTEEQLKSLYAAKAEIEAGEAKLLSRKELKARIQEAREQRRKAS